MQMERINLVAGNPAHQLLDKRGRHIITPHVQHHAPQGEGGFVADLHGGHEKTSLSFGNQLPQRLQGIKKTAKAPCSDSCLFRCDGQDICFPLNSGVQAQLPCQGTFLKNILAHGSRNAEHPEYILHFPHQVIPAGNIPV